MSAIKQALSKLDRVVGVLEQSLSGKQRDMFAAPKKKAHNNNGTGNLFETAVMAQRLDSAIEKVEVLLGKR